MPQVKENKQELKKSTSKKERITILNPAISPAHPVIIAQTTLADTTTLAKVKTEIKTRVPEISTTTLAVENTVNQDSTPVKIEKQPIQVTENASLRELAAERIKERLLDENTIEIQKKTGQVKKINGWDIAQMVTKSVSKLSGRELELKPHYSEDGSVTSYAFSAGEFKISKKF